MRFLFQGALHSAFYPAIASLIILGCSDKSGSVSEPTITTGFPVAVRTERPRIILDQTTRNGLRKAAAANTKDWQVLAARCEMFAGKVHKSGYQGLQWAEAVASLSVCWHATDKELYASRAMTYLMALLNDREKIGDGAGGDDVIQRNSGYPIRAHGVWAALAYDWLYNAPGMTDAIRKTIDQRLRAWISWYSTNGYLNNTPQANYFWGYFTALTMAGLSLEGESEAAAAWLRQSEAKLNLAIIPLFATELRGGSWPEGWQYGPLVSVSLAMIVRAYATAKQVDYTERLPWFGQLARSHRHRLHPDGVGMYGNGTHNTKPVIANPTPLRAAIFVLGGSAPKKAADARYVKELIEKKRAKYPWFALVASLTGDETNNFTKAEPLSYHLPGAGLSFARASWAAEAVWTSFQAGPRTAVDHQNNDQGHFEIWRGGDGLVIDGGDTTAMATSNHNTLLIDDGGRALNYPPNQGIWADRAVTKAFVDDGRVVTIVGDITGAWDPKCAKEGCSKRAVDKVVRTFVFIRPDTVVISDEITLRKGEDDVRWAAHVRAKPTIRGAAATVEIGSSRLELQVLSPTDTTLVAPKEPTPSEDHVYKKNAPKGDVWRIEAPSPRGEKKRHFRVHLRATSRKLPRSPPLVVSENASTGVSGGSTATVLFGDETETPDIVAASRPGSLVAVNGLPANLAYSVLAKKGSSPDVCELQIRPIASANGTVKPRAPSTFTVSKAGAFSFELDDACVPTR